MSADRNLDLRIDSLVRDGVEVLHDLEWSVGRGEHWALVGPNGSGKTTLLRVLAGYLWPTRGSVTVLGERFGATDVRELRKRIGVVSSALVGWLPGNLTARTMVATGFEGSIGLPWVSISATQRLHRTQPLCRAKPEAYFAIKWGSCRARGHRGSRLGG